MNKKCSFLLLCLCTGLICRAETYAPYQIKANFIAGYIYPHDPQIVTPLVKGPALGANLAFEWNMDGSRDWHQDFLNPTIGVGLDVIDLSNPQVFGQLINTYTYINIPFARTEHCMFYVKIGGGIGFATKPCDVEAAASDPRPIKEKAGDYNFVLGSVGNVNVQAGIGADFVVHPQVLLNAEINYDHASNASLAQPNGGLNMLEGRIGLKYRPFYKETPPPAVVQKLPYKRWIGEITLSGGARKLYYKDMTYFGCATFNIAGYYRTCRQHRIGLVADLFYDGSYVETVDNTYTEFKRTYLTENKIENQLRCGIAIANDLVIGKFTMGFQFGIYLYDPIKNAEPYDAAAKGTLPHKGIFYAYDIQKEDGWNYFRIAAKYRITQHFMACIGFKTHLQKVEYMEFGLGACF